MRKMVKKLMIKYCPKCGTKRNATDLFCKNCGQKLNKKEIEQFEKQIAYPQQNRPYINNYYIQPKKQQKKNISRNNNNSTNSNDANFNSIFCTTTNRYKKTR